MYWFYLTYGYGEMGELKWNGKSWVELKYYTAENNEKEAIWQSWNVNRELIDEVALPYQGFPPEELLPVGNYW